MKRIFFLVVVALASASCVQSSGRFAEDQVDEVEEGWVCPMDCEDGKIYDKEGKCPVCDMDLEENEEEE